MMFGGFEAGWAYAPTPPAARAAVPRAVWRRKDRRVTPDCHRIGVSFAQRSPAYQPIGPGNRSHSAAPFADACRTSESGPSAKLSDCLGTSHFEGEADIPSYAPQFAV